MNTINIRRSIRKYKNQPVDRDVIIKLVKAAMQAPSAGNQQPWKFLVLENPEILQKLSNVSPYAGIVARAPAVVVFLIDKSSLKFPEMCHQDLSAAVQNFLLEAVEQGLGAVWLGVSPLREREEFITNLLDLPEWITPFCIVPFGYPVEEEANRFVDRFKPERLYFEHFS